MDNFEDIAQEYNKMVEEISRMSGLDVEAVKEEINKAESFDDILETAFSFMDKWDDSEDDKE